MISIITEGRRHYITGNTYPFRDQIRALGAHWDGERKRWWTWKREEAERLVAKLRGDEQAARQEERENGISTSANVIRGRVEYHGKTYYLLARGTNQDGKPYAKLCFRDGSKVFWATDPTAVRVLKEYPSPCSIDWLRSYASDARARNAGGAQYNSGDYMITRDGRHLARHSGPRGSYWAPATARDEFDEFDI